MKEGPIIKPIFGYVFSAIDGAIPPQYKVFKQWRESYYDAQKGEPTWHIWAERELGTVDQKTKDKIEKGQV